MNLARAALGSLIAGNGHPSDFDHDDFPDARHRSILAAVRTCEPSPEPTLIWQAMRLSGHPRAFWEHELKACVDEQCSARNLPVVRRLLREERRRREVRRGIGELAASIDTHWQDGVVAESLARLHAMRDPYSDASAGTMGELAPALFTAKDHPPTPLGLTCLADLRVRPGDLLTVAARPGVGKTAMLGTIALAAARAGHPVLFLSLEMPVLQIMQRLLAADSRIPLYDIQSQSDPRMVQAAQELSTLPIRLVDESRTRLTVEACVSMARRFVAEQGPRSVVMVDYLQLMRSSGRFERRYELIGHTCQELKHLALSESIPVITAAQLSRNAENANRKPILSDLRESGDIEQTSDSVLLLHREDSKAFLKVAKQRQGPCFKREAEYTGHLCLFEDEHGE